MKVYGIKLIWVNRIDEGTAANNQIRFSVLDCIIRVKGRGDTGATNFIIMCFFMLVTALVVLPTLLLCLKEPQERDVTFQPEFLLTFKKKILKND